MDFGATHRFLKKIEIASLLERVLGADGGLWDSEEDLRRALTGNRPSQSIYLYYTNALYMPHDCRIAQVDVSRRKGWDHFHSSTIPIVDEIIALYPPGSVVVRCQIARLLPGGTIARHSDLSPLLRASHRVHVPLRTSPEVKFFIDGQPFHFGAGQAFELNNQLPHEVHHGGTTPRYHLIFDVLPPDYDPEPMARVARSELAKGVPRFQS